MNMSKYLLKGCLKTSTALRLMPPLNEITEIFILTSLLLTLEKYLYNICLISLYSMMLVNRDHYRGVVEFFNNYRKSFNKPNCVSIQNIRSYCVTI